MAATATGPKPKAPAAEAAPAKSGTAAKAASAKPKPVSTTLVVKINLSSQTMSLQYDGARQETWAISSGREGYATPRGVFRPQWASKMWYSRKYDDAPMPNAVFFVGGVAVHGTQATRLLGRPASHGCVRLAPRNAARFFSLVHKHGYKHTRIEVFGTPPPSKVARTKGEGSTRRASSEPRRRTSSRVAGNPNGGGVYGWVPPPTARSVRRGANGIYYLPPNSPLHGRDSFVYNGVVYRRVR